MRDNTVIRLSIQRMVCTACGSEANASCNCGKPYVPAKQRAIEAIAANPQKSDHAIADEIGVSHMTVGRARKETGTSVPVDEPRIGLDGKVRRLPVHDDKAEQREDRERNRAGLIIFSGQAAELAEMFLEAMRECGSRIPDEAIQAVERAAAAWSSLAAQLRGN